MERDYNIKDPYDTTSFSTKYHAATNITRTT